MYFRAMNTYVEIAPLKIVPKLLHFTLYTTIYMYIHVAYSEKSSMHV